jgi:LmbE family N-acetylglucosaminyl deacetylase
MATKFMCIISPHIDDAYLSLSETIIHHHLGSNIIVLNVFTTTNYLGHKSKNKDFKFVSLATSTRISEELRFSDFLYHRRINYLPFFLGFSDSCLEEERFIREESNNYIMNRIKKIKLIPQLRTLLNNFQEIETLFFPTGLGNHLDHLTLRSASKFFKDKYETWFYADIPYLNRYGSISEVKKALPVPIKRSEIKKFKPKLKANLFKELYKTQYYPNLDNELTNISRNLGGEILFR